MPLLGAAGTVATSVHSVKQQEPDGEQVASEELHPPTRGAFRKGALLATLIILPGLSLLLDKLGHTPLAKSVVDGELFATIAVFAGLPTLLVFGGIGKNVARQRKRSRPAMMLRGSLLGILAGLGSALLAAIPTATLPHGIGAALIASLASAAIGALTGGLLGLWIHYARARDQAACSVSKA